MFVCDELRLKATLSLTFNEVFVVKGVKIIDGRQGMFVAMPSRKTEGGFEDICHPVSTAYRDYVENEIFLCYARQTGIPIEEIQARRRISPEPGTGHPRSGNRIDDNHGEHSRPPRRPRGDSEGSGGSHPES